MSTDYCQSHSGTIHIVERDAATGYGDGSGTRCGRWTAGMTPVQTVGQSDRICRRCQTVRR